MGYKPPRPDPRIRDDDSLGKERKQAIEESPHYNGLIAPSGYQLTYGERRKRKPIFIWTIVCVLVGAIILAIALAPNLGLSNGLINSWFDHDDRFVQVGEVNLISPLNDANLVSDSVLLSWSSVEGADSYVLSIVGSELGLMNVTVQSNQYLLKKTGTFSWSVCAIKDGKIGPSSQIWSFSIKATIDTPTPISPENGYICLDKDVSLRWTSVPEADNYRVQIAEDANYSQLVLDLIVDKTQFGPTISFIDGQYYHWRVAAIHDSRASEWSESQTFFFPPQMFVFSHSWIFDIDDSQWTLEVEIPSSAYYEAKNTYRLPRTYVQGYALYVQPYDPVVKDIAAKLKTMAASKGYDSYLTANFVLSFLQTIPHALDNESVGIQDYPRYPVETLVDYTGDCEDFNALYASIIQSSPFNYDSILVYLSNGVSAHIAVGLNVNPPSIGGLAYWTYMGTKYYYADAMAPLPMVGLPWDPFTWEAILIPS